MEGVGDVFPFPSQRNEERLYDFGVNTGHVRLGGSDLLSLLVPGPGLSFPDVPGPELGHFRVDGWGPC